jgi:hypothetical protein
MNVAEIKPGQTVAYRKAGSSRRLGLYVLTAERVSERSVYLWGHRVRLSDGAHLGGDTSVVLAVGAEVDEVTS